MVMSSRRTYADAIGWIKSARPPAGDRKGTPGRVFGACFAVAVVIWGVGAYVSPESFGQPGAEVLSLGWPTLVLVGLVVACAVALFLARDRIGWVAARVREPYERTLSEDPAFEGAVNALAACPRPLQLRFALGWTWGPMLAVVASVVFAFSAAYLVIYAILSRLEVGWQTFALGAADVALGVGLLAIMAGRLATWRLATSVYRSIILM
jgi:hypothetical protein